MKKVPVDSMLFEMAFNRDTDFHEPYPFVTYLDYVTGNILWLYKNGYGATMNGVSSKENTAQRKSIASDKDRYLRIPGKSHGAHHGFLQEFLDSPWSSSESEMQAARSAYFGSIGGWIKTVDNQNAVDSYMEYKNKKLEELGSDFLLKHGIHPIWR